MGGTVEYDDGRVCLDRDGIRIAWYYPWGAKRLAYSQIRRVQRRPLNLLSGKWRIWGSGDLRHWYNLDPRRPGKSVALELDTGRRVRPTITPDDPEKVHGILSGRIGGAG